MRPAPLLFSVALLGLAGCYLGSDQPDPAPSRSERARFGLSQDIGFGRQIPSGGVILPEFPVDRIRVSTDQGSGVPDFPAPALALEFPGRDAWVRTTRRTQGIAENPLQEAGPEASPSTFAVDVDTASYSSVRRFLDQRLLPPPRLVRIEEMVNYFPYAYAPPAGDEPFATHVEVADCPWSSGDRLVRIGLKGRVVERARRPSSNLVFLIDVSGSMRSADKLPLLKRSLRLLVRELGENDRVALVVYAGAAGRVLNSTSCAQQDRILEAIDRLEAGGSTNGGAGIELAYQSAVWNFIRGGVNRVILATDGDFNVGIEDEDDLEELIVAKAKTGVFLSVLGFGPPSGDGRMETLADRGNGNYAGIDSLREARKVLVEQMGGTLVTIAKDVKARVTFDPALVKRYRLIGYENRLLSSEEFDDDAVDAGDIGAGHAVTALYQVELREGAEPGGELLELELRTKEPDAERSTLQRIAVVDRTQPFVRASVDLRFAAAVGAFGMLLRGSKYAGCSTWERVEAWARASAGADPGGYRKELIGLVRRAAELSAAREQTRAAAQGGQRG